MDQTSYAIDSSAILYLAHNCAVIAMNGKLTITLSRFCRTPELEEVFFRQLEAVMAAL